MTALSLLFVLAMLGPAQEATPKPAPQAIPLGSTYDPQNPFARMLAGSLGTVAVAETDTALAFMDHRPKSRGHVLVIPKSRTVSLLDSTPAQLAGVMALARCVAIAQTAAFKSDGLVGISLVQNNGAPNQHVGHLHVHLVPNYADRSAARADAPVSPDQLAPIAARIRAAMPTEGC